MIFAPQDVDAMLIAPIIPIVPERAPLSANQTARRGDLIRGLWEPAIVPEDADSLDYWQLGTFNAFKPRNAWEDWLGQQASVMMFRISRAERIERRLRELESLRAIDFWEDDQILKAEEVGARLTREPGPTYAALWSTPAGCDWLIARWETLAAVPADQWTEAQRQFVRLVCPVRPHEVRDPQFVATRIKQLVEQRERTRDHDRALRALVEADISEEVSKPLGRLRRYRATLQRQLKWFVEQLRVEPPEHRLDHRYRPDFERRLVEPHLPTSSATPVETGSSAVAEVSAPAGDETDPSAILAGSGESAANETKPTESMIEEIDLPQVIAELNFAIPSEDKQARSSEARHRRPDPARELKRLRKAARRRSA